MASNGEELERILMRMAFAASDEKLGQVMRCNTQCMHHVCAITGCG